VVSAGDDRTVKVWDASTGKEVRTLAGHRAAVTCVAFSPDGKRLAAGILAAKKVLTWEPSEITVWDLDTGQAALTLRGHFDYDVRALTFSPDGSRLASAGGDGVLKLWEPATGQEILTLSGHRDWVNGVAFSPDGRYLASASSDGTVVVWDGSPPDAGER
jgi:WD40 repeat protein